MNQVAVITELADSVRPLREFLDGIFETRHLVPGNISDHADPPGQYTVADVKLDDASFALRLRRWINRKPQGAKVIVVVNRDFRLEVVRANSVGATDLVSRPIEHNALLAKLYGDFNSLAFSADFEAASSPGVMAALGALQAIFAVACGGAPLDQEAIDEAGNAIVGQIASHGLANWIEIVRKHHSRTYQHCLLVTGLAVGFGHQLRFAHQDLKHLAIAGMLHDIGKARVPVAILEKPRALEEHETRILKEHVPFGVTALQSTSGIPQEILKAVADHHEYLDGSGYPRGLRGDEISDFVRIITIADIFGALIERRAYKAPWSGDAAYKELLNMGPKLDRDFVREFGAIYQIKARQTWGPSLLNVDPGLRADPGQQPSQRFGLERHATRGWRSFRTRHMHEHRAATPRYSGPGIVVDFDDPVVQMVIPPQAVAWFIGRAPKGPVVATVSGIFTPRDRFIDRPDGEQGQRPWVTVGPPPQAPRPEAAARGGAITFALVGADPGSSEHDRNGKTTRHQQATGSAARAGSNADEA